MRISEQAKIWLNGRIIPGAEAQTHVLTHTLHYGLGVFEGVRAYETDDGTAIFRLPEHTHRLFLSAKIMGMELPFSEEEISQAQRDVVRENGLKAAYIRPMCYYGSETIGLHASDLSVHAMVAAGAMPVLHSDGRRRGIRAKISSFSRLHVNVSMCKAKVNGNYVNSMLAVQEVKKAGYDEALMLDTDGFLVEGSGQNIFLVRNGQLHTPELTSVLDGITRRTVARFAEDLGLEIRERRITRDEAYIADEVFLVGTATEILPVREVDDRVIGDGERGPITEKLQLMYTETVSGKRPEYKDWLTPV